MTNCTQDTLDFPPLSGKKIQAEFKGGDITSDGGVLLLRNIDRRLGLLEAIDNVISDPRDPRYLEHSQLSLLRQRVYGLCLGYEDLNDHQQLRQDPAIQTAVNREAILGSQSTLCRLENRTDRDTAVAMHNILVDQFIASFKQAPKELILDFDATDDPIHAHLSKGANPRFIISNLEDQAQHLYEKVYCARGEMENRIKEQQLGLFADRTSCHDWWPNQFRLLLSSLAYVLMENIRRLAKDTELEKAQVHTLRIKLLKIGAVILRNTRRIRFLLSENYPWQDLFFSYLSPTTNGINTKECCPGMMIKNGGWGRCVCSQEKRTNIQLIIRTHGQRSTNDQLLPAQSAFLEMNEISGLG